jgi:isoleucyl-tRNA synthetase
VVDDITFKIDGETYTRIDKVMDSWFEAGSMPFAQFHYPFENKEKFEANFPGDFIVEYIGQVRAWFYYMHAMNVALFGENSFKNVIVTGNVAGNDGRKMSKSYGNYTDPNELMDKFSADSLRFLLLSSPLLNGEDFALQDKEVGDVARKLSMIWNMYDFFTMYAEVDGWEYKGELTDPLEELNNPLDIWIVSRVHQLVAEVEKNMDSYNIPDALTPILPFLDDASNWYVRRSRRRFWKSEDDGDKNDAYQTLHYVLVRLSYTLAPFTPFLAEELYHKLTGDNQSVHLKDWLPAGRVNQLIVDEMKQARGVINDILSLRAKEGIKTRQPLSHAKVETSHEFRSEIREMVIDEVNIKTIDFVQNPDLEGKSVNTKIGVELAITPELKREGLMREFIRHVQSARKNAGFNVDDRIKLGWQSDSTQLAKAVKEHEHTIMAETLVSTWQTDIGDAEPSVIVKIEGEELKIYIAKA